MTRPRCPPQAGMHRGCPEAVARGNMPTGEGSPTTMWPEGKGFAVAFTFDFDAEEAIIADDPANADRPGALSQGTYGAKVAVPLAPRAVGRQGRDRHVLHPGPGRRAAPVPRRGDRRRGPRGRAPRVHAHLADDAQPRRRGRSSSTKGLEVLRSFGDRRDRLPLAGVGLQREHRGAPASGTGSPTARTSWTTSAPYRHEGTGLIELPIQWTLDDAAHFWFDADSWNKKISTAEEVRVDLGGRAPRLPPARRRVHPHDAPADHRASVPARAARGVHRPRARRCPTRGSRRAARSPARVP